MAGKTFVLDELFKFSSNFNAEFDGEVLTIDNFYEDPDTLYEWIKNRDYPMWKYNTESSTRNGIDYYDCRIVDTVGHPTRIYVNEHNRILDLCRRYFHKGEYEWQQLIEYNCFQTIEEFDNVWQHYPHIDSPLDRPDNLSTLNFLVYMDKEEDGGTAIYDGEWITNDENMTLLYPVEQRFNLERVIPAKFNRAVIFPGNRMHGAWIDDYSKYKDNWRFTQVLFYHPIS